MKELGTIEEEAAECRKAFEGVEVGAPVWCCHHERLSEVLDEPAENRITYILTSKDRSEQAIRLREFRPVKDRETFAPLYADYEAKRAPLYADYEAKRDTLYADYEAKRAPLYADYEAKRDTLDADYRAKSDTLYADYRAKLATLYADYMAKIAPLDADYEAKIAPLDADYEAKRATLDADLTALHLAEYPDTAWNGRSIFE